MLSRNEWVKVCEAATGLKTHIERRQQSLEFQLNRPIQQLLTLVNGAGRPEGWEITDQPPDGLMERTNFDGHPTLHVMTRADAAASWRTSVLLSQGRYRFEGRAQVVGVQPLPYGTHQGAGLRIGGAVRQERSLIGDVSWQMLTADFAVEEPRAEVELVCELRAHSGEAWFDLDSLRVVRTNDL